MYPPDPLDITIQDADAVLEMYERFGDFPDTSLACLDTLEGVLEAVEGDEYAPKAQEAIRYLWERGARPIGIGTTRVTFLWGSYGVAKVPLGCRGVMCSVREAEMSRSTGKTGEIPIADCHLDQDRLILWMERVEPSHEPMSAQPDWAWMVDGFQVGYDREGVLVAYDL